MNLRSLSNEQGLLHLDLSPGPFKCEQRLLPGKEDGLHEIEITFKAQKTSVPHPFRLSWREPMREIHYGWRPGLNEDRLLEFKDTQPKQFVSKSSEGAPVVCLYKINGENSVLFALSDTMHENRLSFQMNEEGVLNCSINLFDEKWESIKEYSIILRVDRRPIPMQSCLKDCALWWDQLIPGTIGDLPEGTQGARCCVRGHLDAITQWEVESRSTMAVEMGMSVFSFGAGWPEISLSKPDRKTLNRLARYVNTLHKKGMKAMVRVNPSYGNDLTQKIFKDKLIGSRDAYGELIDPNEAQLDFRFPEVRAYIIENYKHMLGACALDGLILSFPEGIETNISSYEETMDQDFFSMNEAFSVFLKDLKKELRNLHPDVLIEVHQPVSNPHVLKVANMVRAHHCGSSFSNNRVRILDLRLLSGRVIPHASPVFWDPSDPVESAAMQLTHTLFATPQIATSLEMLPPDHLKMLNWYLTFWKEHRDVILQGELTALQPQDGYPLVIAQNRDKLIVAVYSNALVALPQDLPPTLLLVNGTYRDHIVLEHEGNFGIYSMQVYSCTGEKLIERQLELKAGLNRIDVPINAYVTLKENAPESGDLLP